MIKIRLAVMNDDACWIKPAFDYTAHKLNAEFYAVYVDLELPLAFLDKDMCRFFEELSIEQLESFIESCDNYIRLEVDKKDREKAIAKDHLYELHDDMYNEFGVELLYYRNQNGALVDIEKHEEYDYVRIENVDTELMLP